MVGPWALLPTQSNSSEDYCGAVLRNIGIDYRRSVRQRADPAALPEEPARLPDENLVGAPLAGEIEPGAPLRPGSHHRRL